MIERDLQSASRQPYDVVVIGGGIYGACVLLEAARRGLRAVLIERDDFGSATSANSLRILHGGLRYLQSANLCQFRAAVAGRHWFCRHFPEWIEPLPCLLPLYGDGLKRPAAMRAALRLNDWLAGGRNQDVPPSAHLPESRLLTRDEAIAWFPDIDRRGLRGAGLWYDARMRAPQRILIEILRWACWQGATALNYVTAERLTVHGSQVTEVRAWDRVGQRECTFRGRVVVNCAGPWSPEIAAPWKDSRQLFPPSLAFNVLFDRKLPARAALALSDRTRRGAVRFLCPWEDQLCAGTVHLAAHDAASMPGGEQVRHFVHELNRIVPSLGLTVDAIAHVYRGLLPAARPGTATLRKRARLVQHAAHGGPANLLSVAGVKYTTAAIVARRAVSLACPWAARRPLPDFSARPAARRLISTDELLDLDGADLQQTLAHWIQEEAVMCREDLLFRRTDWYRNPAAAQHIVTHLRDLLPQANLVLAPAAPGAAESTLDRSQDPSPEIPERAHL